MAVGFKNSPFVKQVSSIGEPLYNYGVRPIYNLSSGAINLANKLAGSMFGYDGGQITPYASKMDFTQPGEQFYPFNLFVPNTTANASQQTAQSQLDPNMFFQDSLLRTQELTPPSDEEIKQKKVEAPVVEEKVDQVETAAPEKPAEAPKNEGEETENNDGE